MKSSTQIKEEANAILDTVAIRLNQHGRELYQFSLPASKVHDLIVSNKMDIDRWGPTNPDGYQRVPTESRYKKFGKFVAVTKGISPVSVLLSLRDKGKLRVEELDDGKAVRLRIRLDGERFYVPDGQHRAFGLRWAVDEYAGTCEDYEVPVVLFLADGDDPRYEEAQQFYTINNYAKRVRTDLAQRYLLRKREKELGELTDDTIIPSNATLKDLEPYAVKISDLMNQSGPLEGKIEPPNMSVPTTSISQSSFVDAIKPLLARAAELHWDIRKVKATLTAFWNAVKYKCPEAFEHWSDDVCDETTEDHFDAVLATTSGIYSLNNILARSLLLPDVAKAPTSPETFKALLSKPSAEEYFSDGPEGYWSSQSQMDDSAASHGTGRKSFKEVADDIWNALVEA